MIVTTKIKEYKMENLPNTLEERNTVTKEYVESIDAEKPTDNSSSTSDTVLEPATANPEDLAARHEFLENTFIKNQEQFSKISALRRGKRSVSSYLLNHGITKEEAKIVMRRHLKKTKVSQHQD